MKRFLSILCVIIVSALVAFLFTRQHYKCKHTGTMSWHETEVVFDTLTYVDTIPYYKPVAKEVKPNGYTEVSVSVDYLHGVLDSLPYIRADTTDVLLCQGADSDSVSLQIPMTQTIYSDSTYKAWVSGVNTRIDSIYVFPKREVITIKHPPKRWHIGISGGYGATRHGLSPYIGVGVTYSLISF